MLHLPVAEDKRQSEEVELSFTVNTFLKHGTSAGNINLFVRTFPWANLLIKAPKSQNSHFGDYVSDMLTLGAQSPHSEAPQGQSFLDFFFLRQNPLYPHTLPAKFTSYQTL